MNPFEKAAYCPSVWGNNFHTRKENEVMGAGAAGPGKSLCLRTLVPTPDGFKFLRDIHAGDIVFNVHGKQVKVVAESQVWNDLDTYELRIADESVICCGNHLWNTADGRTVSTKDIHNSPFTTSLPFAESTETESSDLLLDPYIYGYCLVRGQPSDRATFTTWDPEAYSILRDIGYSLDDIGHKAARIRERADLINELIPAKQRRIRPEYLRGSFNQRMALVEGIMDGNSGLSPEVDHNDYPFIIDFYCLAASLG